MIRERIQEIFDFFKAESPYRSANKGWLTNDIFLQWKASEQDNSTEFAQIAKVSLYWQPIIQIVLVIFTVISLATFFAFSPLAFSRGKLKSVSSMFNSFQTSFQSQESVLVASAEVGSTEAGLITESLEEYAFSAENNNDSLEKQKASNIAPKAFSINSVVATKKKMITATDLFQPKRE